jgi:hypothetical protein
MRYLKTFLTCLVALALHSAAWAEIYETTDAQGNTEFTDSPADEGAEVVELQQTNLADAPPPEPQDEEQADTVAVEQEPVEENNTVIIHDGDDYDGYDDELARDRALERRELAAPGDIVDPGYEMPREVGDSNAQMPREVGDFPKEHEGVHRR